MHLYYNTTLLVPLLNLYLFGFLSINQVHSVSTLKTKTKKMPQITSQRQQQQNNDNDKTRLAKTTAFQHFSTSYSTSALLLRQALISFLYKWTCIRYAKTFCKIKGTVNTLYAVGRGENVWICVWFSCFYTGSWMMSILFFAQFGNKVWFTKQQCLLSFSVSFTVTQARSERDSCRVK